MHEYFWTTIKYFYIKLKKGQGFKFRHVSILFSTADAGQTDVFIWSFVLS